jgi:hypothetical protein
MSFIYKEDYKFIHYLKDKKLDILGAIMVFNFKKDPKSFFN